ncbi:MAG: hypothetical protein JW776_15490 [Candidatus Lokiarchaeota archaeon]|nr:hypothetical protein [Candidatus Lokiarchaeota archaeon]
MKKILSKINLKKNRLRRQRIILIFGRVFSFIPIIASILAPMFVAFGLFIYLSYIVFLYPHIDIVNYYAYVSPLPVLLLVIEGILLLLGLYFFIDSLFTMGIARKSNKEPSIVQNRMYKYIRHPQNLGILLIFLSFSLYIPFVFDIGIRSGDLLSWILFYVFTSLKSIHEESVMFQKFGNEYWMYIQKTGFFIPFSLNKRRIKNNLDAKAKKRYFTRRILVLSSGSLIFLSLEAFFFIIWDKYMHVTLVRFPPALYIFPLENRTLIEWVPFIIFGSITLIVISLLIYNERKKRSKKKRI